MQADKTLALHMPLRYTTSASNGVSTMQTQSNINASTVAALLAGTAGATFAQITYTTVVATAAAHKLKILLCR